MCCSDPTPPLLLQGIEELNAGRYFEQHETLETLWRAETRPVRRLYQGILQIGVAFHHLQAGNYHGTVYMLARGAAYLRDLPPVCLGVDVAHLRASAARALAEVERLGPARLSEFTWSLAPRVKMVTR